jgi:hypothetical protein
LFTQTIPLPLGRIPLPRLCRHRRRPFLPRESVGPYKLPRGLSERLTVALAGYRNAEASYELAIFLARYWSAPNRIDQPFPIDRRALQGHSDLALSEGQIRGAIKTLERVGFLERVIPEGGSRYRATEEGLHRKPILFRFGTDYVVGFRAACKRSVPNQRRVTDTRSIPAATISPKDRIPSKPSVLMGSVVKAAKPSEPNPAFEAALDRFKRAFEERQRG